MITKAELATIIAEKTGFTKKQANAMLDAFTDTITEKLSNGETVRLTGFGTFESRLREARTGIDPQTKKKIKIAAKYVPAFKAGQTLKNAVACHKG